MALNKRQTSTWTKALIITLVLVFAVGILLPFVGLLGSGGQANTASNATTQTAAAAIAQKYTGRIQFNDQALASDPASYTALVDNGNAYFDWAIETGQDQASAQAGLDRPFWLASKGYYERALKVQPDDLQVKTDYSVTQYYSGEASAAVATIQQVLATDPKFPQGLYNAGIFYQAIGQKDKAINAFEAYLKLPADKQNNVDFVKSQLAELKK